MHQLNFDLAEYVTNQDGYFISAGNLLKLQIVNKVPEIMKGKDDDVLVVVLRKVPKQSFSQSLIFDPQVEVNWVELLDVFLWLEPDHAPRTWWLIFQDQGNFVPFILGLRLLGFLFPGEAWLLRLFGLSGTVLGWVRLLEHLLWLILVMLLLVVIGLLLVLVMLLLVVIGLLLHLPVCPELLLELLRLGRLLLGVLGLLAWQNG